MAVNRLGTYYGWEVLDLGAYEDFDGVDVSGPGRDEDVILCRRKSTSGTQVASDTFFLGKGCSSSSSEPSSEADSVDRYRVIEAESASKTKTCLASASQASVGERYAIAVLSAEHVPTKEDPVTWAWLKLNGAAINADKDQRKNTIHMQYLFAMEMKLHTNKSLDVTPANQAQALYALTKEMGNTTNPSTGLYVVPNGTNLYVRPGSYIGRATRNAIKLSHLVCEMEPCDAHTLVAWGAAVGSCSFDGRRGAKALDQVQ